jgi:hypothetical protein
MCYSEQPRELDESDSDNENIGKGMRAEDEDVFGLQYIVLCVVEREE